MADYYRGKQAVHEDIICYILAIYSREWCVYCNYLPTYGEKITIGEHPYNWFCKGCHEDILAMQQQDYGHLWEILRVFFSLDFNIARGVMWAHRRFFFIPRIIKK